MLGPQMIACSTPENCTNCEVNSEESIGARGSWFCNCATSSLRKLSKFWFRALLEFAPALVAVAALAVSTAVTMGLSF